MPTAPANRIIVEDEEGNNSLEELPPPEDAVSPTLRTPRAANPAPTSTIQWSPDPVQRRQQVRDEIARRRSPSQNDAASVDSLLVGSRLDPNGTRAQQEARVHQQANEEFQYQQQTARQQEIEQRRSQIDQQKGANAAREATMRGTGQQFYTDPYGNLQPVIEAGTNRPLYHPSPWEPTEHPETKEPALTMRDRYGQRQFKAPPIVASPDLTDDQLYYKMADDDLRPAGKIDDLKRHANPSIARLAKRTDAQRRSAMWKEAIAPMEAVAAEAAVNHDLAEQRVMELGAQIDGLTKQSELTANPEAKAKIDAQLQGLMGEQMTLQDDIKPTGKLGRLRKTATLDLAIFKAKAQHDSYADLAEERRDILKAQGKPEAGDPTLAAILQAQETYGKAIDRAATVAERDALMNVRPATPANKFETQLNGATEQQFQKWKQLNAPNDSGADYDLRGAFKAGLKPDANGHWPDTFKKPNHPTFSDQSIYAKDAPDKAGHWEGDVFVPPGGSPNGSKTKRSAKAFARGATAEGVYAATEGGARVFASSPVARTIESIQDAITERVQGFPLTEEQKASRAADRAAAGRQTGATALNETVKGYAEQTGRLREQIRKALPIDEAFAKSKLGQIAQGVGQAAGTLPAGAVGAPALLAASVGQIYDEAYQDAKQSGADDATAHSAAMKYLPAAGLDFLSDRLIVGKLLKPMIGKATVGQILKDVLVTSASEGVTEGAQQTYLNQVASKLEGYDPNRPFDKEVLDSMLVGAVVGGGVTAVGQGAKAVLPRGAAPAAPGDGTTNTQPVPPAGPKPTGALPPEHSAALDRVQALAEKAANGTPEEVAAANAELDRMVAEGLPKPSTAAEAAEVFEPALKERANTPPPAKSAVESAQVFAEDAANTRGDAVAEEGAQALVDELQEVTGKPREEILATRTGKETAAWADELQSEIEYQKNPLVVDPERRSNELRGEIANLDQEWAQHLDTLAARAEEESKIEGDKRGAAERFEQATADARARHDSITERRAAIENELAEAERTRQSPQGAQALRGELGEEAATAETAARKLATPDLEGRRDAIEQQLIEAERTRKSNAGGAALKNDLAARTGSEPIGAGLVRDSDGTVRPAEQAPTEVDFADETPAVAAPAPAAESVAIGARDETVSTGTGVPTAKETEMLAEQQRLIDEAPPTVPQRKDFSTLAQYRAAVKKYVDQNRSTVRQTVTPSEDKPVGKNARGESLYDRADGSRYRMDDRRGAPSFGGDLAPVEDTPAKPTPPDAAPVSIDTPAPTPESVEGDRLSKSWTAFSPESGSLGIPRAEMPQIASEHRGALVNFLNARGITTKKTMVMPDQLRPTQAEFSPAKVQAAREHQGSDRPILISSDGHVVDGHHQWLASLDDTTSPLPVIRLNAPIDKVLAEMKEFPSAEQAKGATAPAPKTEAAKSASSKISDYTQDEWETLAEELVDASDLAGGSGGRAGRLSYELQEVVQSFADAARETPDMTIEQAFKNFKGSTDASESRVRQLRSILADHKLLGAPVATPKLGDRAVDALQKAIERNKSETKKFVGSELGLVYQHAERAALEIALLAVRAGRAAVDVTKLALDRFKAKHPKHTPEELARVAGLVNAAVTTAEAARAKKIAAPGEAKSRVPESLRAVDTPAEDITYDVRNQNARMAEARAIISRDGTENAEAAISDRNLAPDTRVALGGVLLERKMAELRDAKPADVPRLTQEIQRLAQATQSGVSTESGQGVAMHAKIYQNLAVGSAMEYVKSTNAKRLEKMGGKDMADAAQDAADALNKAKTPAERDAAIDKLKERYTTGPVRRALDQLKRVEVAKELNKLGVLTRDDLVEVAGNALGIPGIEQSKLKHIAELADAVDKAKDHAERSRAELALADTLSIYKGVSPLDLESSILTLNILSGPTTQAANIEGNALNLLAQLGTTAAVNPTKIGPIWDGLKQGIPLAWDQAKSILATGRGTRDFQDRTLGASNALQNIDYARDFPALNEKVGDALTMRARAVEKIGRFMKAADAVFYYPAREAYARLVATKLLEGKFSGPELAKRVSETLHTTPAAFEAARQQAAREGYTGIDAGRRVSDIIEEQRAKTVEGKEAVKQSERFAAEATYNNEPVGLAGVVYRNLARTVKDADVGGVPVLKPWAMFLRVPANVFNATTNFTPAGAVRAAMGMKGEKYRKGGTGEGQWRNFSKDERNRLYLQSVIGTTLMAALTASILKDDDKVGVTAGGPSDPNQRRQLQNAGWNPYSIKVGDKWISYKDSPLLVPLAIIGHVADAVKYQKAKGDMVLENRVTDAIAHAPQIIFQTSMLSGLADLMSSMGGKDASLSSVARTLGSVPANLVIPYNRLLQQIDQTFDDKSYKSNPLVNAVPFARRTGKEQTDVQGRAQTYSPTSRFASTEKGDPVDTILRDKNIFIPEAGKDTKIGNRTMTDDEHEKYRRLSGQRIRVRLQSIIPRLRLMTQEKAQDEVQRIAREERERVKPLVVLNKP